ncbi:GntR family transcriptional regulator [Malaciobacter pacificus]|jgi:putative oxidoreductase|uniref:Putative membrane protein, DoxX family n=1 Tax=Malaciobacter pacificus TaxID=1080223 RepID=A0A5C2H448_9BACT|nr:DoxX family protein [Malaciobacter pacificus]QEP33767.1 putative membrane protein, DoxX family [Malaciobacter pacificus]GGD33140.1 GntR family transcriptional regulator [Malaciobacter pacificus]
MNLNSICTYTNEDLGKLVLRFAVAILMLFHGVAKLQSGLDGIISTVESNGLPTFVAYGVYLGEILAPIMLLIGYRVKLASILIIGTMGFILFFYSDSILALNKYGAWAIELQMFYITTSITIFFLGAGKYSLDKR